MTESVKIKHNLTPGMGLVPKWQVCFAATWGLCVQGRSGKCPAGAGRERGFAFSCAFARSFKYHRLVWIPPRDRQRHLEQPSALVTHSSVKELTKDGRDGIILNSCMLCGADAGLTGTNSLGEDLFKCSAGNCQVEFKETELGPKLLPSSFEEDVEYEFHCGDGTRFSFIVRKASSSYLEIEVFGGGGSIFISGIFVTLTGESEFFTVPRSISGTGERVFPYCRKERYATK